MIANAEGFALCLIICGLGGVGKFHVIRLYPLWFSEVQSGRHYWTRYIIYHELKQLVVLTLYVVLKAYGDAWIYLVACIPHSTAQCHTESRSLVVFKDCACMVINPRHMCSKGYSSLCACASVNGLTSKMMSFMGFLHHSEEGTCSVCLKRTFWQCEFLAIKWTNERLLLVLF